MDRKDRELTEPFKDTGFVYNYAALNVGKFELPNEIVSKCFPFQGDRSNHKMVAWGEGWEYANDNHVTKFISTCINHVHL